MFCVTSEFGISCQHLNHPNLLVRAVYKFHVYFLIRLILHKLGIFYHMEMALAKLKIVTFKAPITANRKISTRQPYAMSKGFIKKNIEKISRSVGLYVYLILTSQVQSRSSIVGKSAPAVDALKVFKGRFKALINEDYSIGIDIERYQGVLQHALSKVDFSVGTGIYILPSNLNLNIGRKKRYNSKILVSNTNMTIGSNRDINRDSKKILVAKLDVPKAVIPTVPYDPVETTVPLNLKILTEKQNDEKLAITLLLVGTGLIAYHFW